MQQTPATIQAEAWLPLSQVGIREPAGATTAAATPQLGCRGSRSVPPSTLAMAPQQQHAAAAPALQLPQRLGPQQQPLQRAQRARMSNKSCEGCRCASLPVWAGVVGW